MPNLQERIDHIMTKQVFGIACTDLTAEMSRRTLYCSKLANGKYSVTEAFRNDAGNVWYQRCKHSWNAQGRCEHCGASKGEYLRTDTRESYAYPFIHKPINEIFKMQFDVIIGNPPYQMNVGVEKENYAIAIYHKFVQQAKKLNPRYLCMIIPARWYAGGRGLDDFRDEMLHDRCIRVIHDFPESIDCFPGVEIQGGVCYFIWNRDNMGDCTIITHNANISEEPMSRPLLEKDCHTLIRYNQSVVILRKIQNKNEPSFSQLVSPQTPFGLITSYKGTTERVNKSDLKMYISGNEKEFKGGSAYCPIDKITKGKEMIGWHKVYISKAYGGGMAFPHMVIGTPFYGEPQTVCNQSYLVIGPLKDKKEADNLISYVKTKTFRFLVLQKKNAQDAMRGVYQFVPLQDFSHPWTDEMLYKKYGLDDKEIAFIESMIRPME